MKKFKRTAVASALLICALSLSSCSQKNGSADNTSPDSASVTTNAAAVTKPAVTQAPITELNDSEKLVTLDEIVSANAFSSVLNENVTTYECQKQYYDDLGNKQKNIYIAVEQRNGNSCYISDDSSGDKYYLNSETGKLYSELFNSFGVPYGIKFMTDAAVEEEIARVDSEHIAFSQFEVITAESASADTITVTTETPVTEDSKWDFLDFFEYINIEQGFTKIKTIYTLDSNSKIIQNKKVFGVNKDSKETKIGDFETTYSDLVLNTPEFSDTIEAMTDLRTVKVTDADKNVIEYSVPKNVLFTFPVPTGYMMFSDPEGQNAFNYSDYMDKDAEVYILPY